MKDKKNRQNKQAGPANFPQNENDIDKQFMEDYISAFSHLDLDNFAGKPGSSEQESPDPSHQDASQDSSTKWQDLKKMLQTAELTKSLTNDLYSTDLNLDDYADGRIQQHPQFEDNRVEKTLDALTRHHPVKSMAAAGKNADNVVFAETNKEPMGYASDDLDIIEKQPLASWYGRTDELDKPEEATPYREENPIGALFGEKPEAAGIDYQELPEEKGEEPELAVREKKNKKKEKQRKEKRKKENKITQEEVEPQQKKKGTKRMAVFGAAMFLFAIIGIVATVLRTVDFTKEILNDSVDTEQFISIVQPLVILDPPPFDDVANLDNNIVLAAAMWDLIMDSNSEKYEQDDFYAYIPQTDMELRVKKMFGERMQCKHESINDLDFVFEYIAEDKKYQVPISLQFITYTPKIEEVEENGDLFILKVGYVPVGSTWGTTSDGAIVEPAPQKYMKYVLQRTSKDEYIIVSLQFYNEEDSLSTVESPVSSQSSGAAASEEAPGAEEEGIPEQTDTPAE